VPKTVRRSPLAAGVLVLLVVVAVTAVACGESDSSSLPDGVVLRVGDASITEQQLDRAVAQSAAELKAQGQTVPSEGAAGYDQFRAQVLDSLRRQKILAFEARECGSPCKVTEQQIDDALAQIVKANFNGKQEEFDAFLKQRGITEAEARDIVKNGRQGLQETKVFNHVTRGVRFSEADARRYYDAHPEEWKEAAGRNAAHILVATEAEANRLRAEVTPENFAQLARENSIDGTAKDGGELGPVQKGQFVPPFEKAALALKDGEISQPVKTQFGWHIIMVDITPARTTSFADAKDQIISSQLAQKRQAEFATWSQEALEKWDDRTVYADADLRPAALEPEQPSATTP
jgi:parvulin-like peptidyl-prolyl isomerase